MKIKKLSKLILSLLLVFVFTSLFLPELNNVSAEANPELRYTVIDEGVRIEGFKDEFYQGESLVIPEQIEGKNVVSIKDRAFLGRKSLKTVVLPSTLTSIGSNAFNDCPALVEINIPANVNYIGDFAFYLCKSLETVTVPNGIKEIEENTFSSCEKLKKVILPEGLEIIDKNAFDFCSSLTEINIPSTVKSIGNQSFSNCKALETIVIPDSVNDIGEMVFKDCIKLKEVTLSNNIPALKRGIFKHCSSIEELKIPDSVKTIENGVFEGCSSIKTITLSKNVRSIASGCLVDCVKLKEINVNSQNEKFHSKDGVLFNSTSKELVFYPPAKEDKIYEIPDDVHGIADYAFYNAKNLTSVRITKDVSYISKDSFTPVPEEILIAADSAAIKYAKQYFTKYTVYNNKTGKTKSVNKNLIINISIIFLILLLAGYIVYKKLLVKKLKLKATVQNEQNNENQVEAEVLQKIEEQETDKISE